MAEETIAWSGLVIHTTEGAAHDVWCTNAYVLYNEKHRGEDRVLPGLAGVSGYPRVRDAVVHTLKIVIRGASHADLRSNIDTVRAACGPVSSGNGTRTVTWTLPDGTTRTADCHVGPLEVGSAVGPRAVLATIDIQIDSGVWT